MSENSITNRLDNLQSEVNSHFNVLPKQPKRPGNFGPSNFNFQSSSRPKNLPFSNINKPKNTESENKLRECMKRNGELTINGIPCRVEIKDLEDLGELGNGTSGHVCKMKHKESGTIIAVKQMRRTGNDEENKRIIMDIDVVLKSHDCPYIVQCLGCFITEADVWICMELMATCFDKLLKKTNLPVPEDILGKVTVATVNALSYLKDKHGVIHRDVKPSNILIDERGNIKLCDFGISGRLVDSKAKTRSAGCAAYMAPERIDIKDSEYDIRADVWSLGISLVELATACFPYKGCNTDFEVLARVIDSDPPALPTDQNFSLEFQSFVRKCLTKKKEFRPKYPELLEQPFIKKYEVQKVDVASWLASVMDIAGLKSRRRLSPSQQQPAEFNRFTKTTNIPNYQYNSNNSGSSYLVHHQNQQQPSTSATTALSSSPLSTMINYKKENTGFVQLPKLSQQQKPTSSTQQSQITSTTTTTNANSLNRNCNKINGESNIVSEMNKMYKKSPFMQRKNSDASDYGISPKRETITIGQSLIRNGSPFAQRKLQLQIHQQQQPQQQQIPSKHEGFWNLQQQSRARQITSSSPLIARKRIPSSTVAPGGDSQYIHLQGNTSPIVLQRFYHQQKQLSEKQEEEDKNCFHHENTNPFHSNIPKYQQKCDRTSMNTPPPQAQQIRCETNPFVYHQSSIPVRQSEPAPNPKNCILFNNKNGKVNQMAGGSTNQSHYNNVLYDDGPINDETKDEQGWFNSIAGVVKRRFASYVKLHLSAGEREKDTSDVRLHENTRPGTSTNPFHKQTIQPSLIHPPSPHLLSDRRHRSPDPPPRFNRGQSPLLLRRNLLELGQHQSPLLQRRYVSASPPLPPRRGSESLPGSPQQIRARINYTPEPHRRIYRPMDQ